MTDLRKEYAAYVKSLKARHPELKNGGACSYETWKPLYEMGLS